MPEDTHPITELPPTELLATLAPARRRRTLRSLNRSSPRVLAGLARDVAWMEATEVRRRDAESTTGRVELDLFHCQLPALDDAGLVRYDAASGSVEITSRGSEADDWLRHWVERGMPVGRD